MNAIDQALAAMRGARDAMDALPEGVRGNHDTDINRQLRRLDDAIIVMRSARIAEIAGQIQGARAEVLLACMQGLAELIDVELGPNGRLSDSQAWRDARQLITKTMRITAEAPPRPVEKTPYPEFCRRPECRGLSNCPRDPTCAD